VLLLIAAARLSSGLFIVRVAFSSLHLIFISKAGRQQSLPPSNGLVGFLAYFSKPPPLSAFFPSGRRPPLESVVARQLQKQAFVWLSPLRLLALVEVSRRLPPFPLMNTRFKDRNLCSSFFHSQLAFFFLPLELRLLTSGLLSIPSRISALLAVATLISPRRLTFFRVFFFFRITPP